MTEVHLALLFRGVVGSVLLAAGAMKMAESRDRRVATLEAYQIVPKRAAAWVALTLPIAELILAILLLGGMLMSASALGSAALLLTFATAMTVNLVRGREVACGCFGVSEEHKVSWNYVAMDYLLAGLCLFIFAHADASLLTVDFLAAEEGLTSIEGLSTLLTGLGVLLLFLWVNMALSLKDSYDRMAARISPAGANHGRQMEGVPSVDNGHLSNYQIAGNE